MSTVLLTGATGLVGSELLRRILSWDPGTTVVLLVRSRRRQTAEQRVDALLADLFPEGTRKPDRGRVRIVEGDLLANRLGLTPEAFEALGRSLTHVYHLGADVRFDLPLQDARDIHVAATRGILDLASFGAARGELERFHHVSTFAAGRRDTGAVILEAPPLLTREFRNTYEQTKAEAEALALERAGDIPLTIHRIGIVVGDSRTGWTSKFDTFYLAMRLLLDGVRNGLKLGRVPVSGRALLNAIPVDFAADALYALGQGRRGQSGEILHFTAGSRATRVADALQQVMDHYVAFLARSGQAAPQLPELVPLDDLTSESLSEALGFGVSPEVLEVLRQLMPYAFDNAFYDNRALMAALAGTSLRPEPISVALPQLTDYVLRTNWGNPQEPRPDLPGRPV